MKYLRGKKIVQFELAKDFYEVYKRCFKANQNNEIVAIPAFVNGFFACEIFLKYLTNNRIKSHDLFELYDALSDKEKDILKAIKFLKEYSNITFENFLKSVQYGFEFWRYIYEDENKEFEEKLPFLYSEHFLNTYLPVIYDLAKEKYNN